MDYLTNRISDIKCNRRQIINNKIAVPRFGIYEDNKVADDKYQVQLDTDIGMFLNTVHRHLHTRARNVFKRVLPDYIAKNYRTIIVDLYIDLLTHVNNNLIKEKNNG